jgi:hypothetical protein
MKFLFAFFLFSTLASAKVIKLTDGQSVEVSFSEKWESSLNLYGVPLMILGPWDGESRPVLTVLPTNLTEKVFAENDLKVIFKDFQKEKEAWVGDHKGELLKYEPITAVKFSETLKGQYIGAEFKLEGTHFIERSYYLFCQGQVFNLKYSLREAHLKYLSELQEMVRSFRCKV